MWWRVRVKDLLSPHHEQNPLRQEGEWWTILLQETRNGPRAEGSAEEKKSGKAWKAEKRVEMDRSRRR